MVAGLRRDMTSWLIPPLKDKDKHFEPEWGLHLLFDSDDPRDKNLSIFGATDNVIKEKLSPTLLKELFGENRKIFVICTNGTTAVTIALSNSASPAHVRLVSHNGILYRCLLFHQKDQFRSSAWILTTFTEESRCRWN